ncbi:MAG: serine/threonine protein kinase, partial [Candidatus Wallbacteria bacterium]|nr:serine/threonine protein kinase [Candidatus Wallbacteria bacterium]
MSETVGPYRVVEELGRGATARALLAVDSRTGAKVVLKVLQEVSSPVHQKRFAREVKALEKLTHPCIVRVVASGVEAGRPWYAMEHLESRPLDRVLRQRWVAEGASVSPAEARQALGDVASALACAHAHKTVHRDLKPSNVLVDAGFSAMLIDFGIARMLAEEITKLTRTGDFVGTPAYAAPEQFEREVADYRTDVYAFGLLAYEVMTGKLPFAELAPMEMIRKRSHDPIAPPGSLNPVVPPGLDRVVLHCLEPDPDARYQTMGDVIADMELAFTGGKPRAQPAARRPAPAVAAVRAPSPASPARVALVAAATAIVGGLFVWRAFDAPAAPDRR